MGDEPLSDEPIILALRCQPPTPIPPTPWPHEPLGDRPDTLTVAVLPPHPLLLWLPPMLDTLPMLIPTCPLEPPSTPLVKPGLDATVLPTRPPPTVPLL